MPNWNGWDSGSVSNSRHEKGARLPLYYSYSITHEAGVIENNFMELIGNLNHIDSHIKGLFGSVSPQEG